MSHAIIYHNPRCSQSRQTLKLLEDNNIEPTVVEYLKTPLTQKTLRDVINMLNISPRELLRTKETAYTDNNLGDLNKTDDDIIQIMINNPILIERPVVVINDKKAAIGRPPENVLEIL